MSSEEQVQNSKYSNVKLDGKYEIGEVYYQGTNAYIHRGTSLKNSEPVLVKIYPLKEEIQPSINRQIENICLCAESQYIVQCYDVYKYADCVIMVMQWCNSTLLQQTITNQQQLMKWIGQLILGVGNMHEKGVLHRAIVPKHIMVKDGQIKIVGLGSSQNLNRQSCLQWAVDDKGQTLAEVDEKYDVHGIGRIMYWLLYGEEIIEDDENEYHEGEKKFPVSQEVEGLMQLLLRDRPHLYQLEGHPAIKKYLNVYPSLSIRSSYIQEMKQNPESQPYKNKELSQAEKLTIYHQCQLALYTYQHLICQIENRKMLDFKSRINKQFMYLVASRCYFWWSQTQKLHESEVSELQYGLNLSVKTFSLVLKEKFTKYAEILTKTESQLLYVIGDKLKNIFQHSAFKQKDIFLTGIQGTDFSSEEQIIFTSACYIPEIIPKILIKDLKMIKYLKNYQKFMTTGLKERKQKSFEELIEEIIL